MRRFLVALLSLNIFALTLGGFGSDKVLLKNVQVVTLQEGKYTTGRRSAPVAQITCLGRNCHLAPKTMQCYNRGFDGVDVQWECKGDMPGHLSFENLAVTCEGYSYPEDPYILAGSCGVEFGLRSSNGQHNQHYGGGGGYSRYSNQNYSRHTGGSSWTTLLFVGFVAFIIYKSCCSSPRVGQPYSPDGSGSTWGGGPGGPGGGPGGPGSGPRYDPNCGPAPSSSSGPGFWSGLGLGGLLGTMFNRPRYGYGGYNRGFGGYNRGFGYGGGMRRGFGGPSSSGFSSSTRTSSGFGGTRRR